MTVPMPVIAMPSLMPPSRAFENLTPSKTETKVIKMVIMGAAPRSMSGLKMVFAKLMIASI